MMVLGQELCKDYYAEVHYFCEDRGKNPWDMHIYTKEFAWADFFDEYHVYKTSKQVNGEEIPTTDKEKDIEQVKRMYDIIMFDFDQNPSIRKVDSAHKITSILINTNLEGKWEHPDIRAEFKLENGKWEAYVMFGSEGTEKVRW